MSSPIQELYQSRVYPAMSHPLSDPAVSAAAALLGGLAARHPKEARILEIGCCSGLNLIPLALRWPGSRLVGIDLSGPSIAAARELAAAAGVTNVEFHAVDLRDFQAAGGGFDFIMAHGFLSWVPDEVKSALFVFCHRHLTPAGIATISYNLAGGWRPRFPVIAKVRAIRQAGAEDEMTALGILRSVTVADSPELPIIDDMLAKGPAILAFDDFGPVNDPWSLDRFVHEAAAAGLRWLGESDPATNLPANLDALSLQEIRRHFPAPLAFHNAVDEASGRTFRSGVLCRQDGAALASPSPERMFELFVRVDRCSCAPRDQRLYQVIASAQPACISMDEVAAGLCGIDRRTLARRVWMGIEEGWILPRIEPVRFEVAAPACPALNGMRRECVRRRLPLVDIWHQPCLFPAGHYAVLEAMDGSRDQAWLSAFARRHCPELAFEPWLVHLAGRGFFA